MPRLSDCTTYPLLLIAGFTVDSGLVHAQATLPQLIAIDTSGSETPNFGLPDAPLGTPVTQLRLRFDAALPAISSSVFRVVEAGADRLADTLACGLLPTGDDIDIGIAGVHWDASHFEATLQLDAPRGLPRGRYRVLACEAIDIGGLPGAAARREFTVDETPVLENPGFDDSIAGWTTPNLPGVATAAHAPLADADDAPQSGALRAVASQALQLAQDGCTVLYPLVGWGDSNWRLSLHHRVVTGSVRITAEMWTGFSGDMGEPECRGPGITDRVFFDAQAAPSFSTYDSGWRPFEAMPLAQLRLWVSSRNGQPFEVLFDDLGLRFDSRVIFRDDFD